MYTIRHYREADKGNVQKICLLTADSMHSPLNTQRYILIMYCNYYVEQEPENCFVVADEKDEAVGYIFCSENYDRYSEVFNRLYSPQIKCLGPRRYMDTKLDMLSHYLFKKNYPAHLHIDIHPAFQRAGAGTALINALIGHLKAKGLDSLMLVVAANNIKGRNFYRKNKFKELLVTGSGVAMGIRF